MRRILRSTIVGLASLALVTGAFAQGPATKTQSKSAAPAKAAAAPQKGAGGSAFSIPVDYYKLKNGLRVVLSPDDTAPTVTVAVYYNIGFRIEPQNRTGFAHLFEHMMFQGSQNLGKMEFIRLVQKNGGIMNGSTRFDFTNYFQTVPENKLETILWAEADRMRGLDITQENLTNQQGVVSNEVRVNVLNTPYGGWPWLDMPQYANTNWFNAHNFYGDLKDLEAATLEDVKSFFDKYYAPSNAALVITGDFNAANAKALVAKYFDSLPTKPVPTLPDIAEPKQTQEKNASKVDDKAPRPAIAIAYHLPKRNTPEYYAMGIIDQILVQGEDSLLVQELAKKRGYTDTVNGGINYLGNMFNYNGPMFWMFDLTHDAKVSADDIKSATDGVIAQLTSKPVDQATIDRAMVKLRSSFYDTVDNGFGRADLLASFALFDDNPARINTLENEFKKVTPAMIQKVAAEYLKPSNRTVLVLKTKEAK